MRRNGKKLAALASLALAGATLAACSSGGVSATASATNSASASGSLQTVSVQLKWFTQGQFAGYIAAKAQGFYAAQGLNVDILNGGPDTVAENAVADGSADFADAWVPDALAAREKGANIVDVAQVFQRAGMQEYSLKSSGITSPADFKGKNIGVNGVNQLIWPSPSGIGMTSPTAWNDTVQIAENTKETDGTPMLASAPTAGAYTNTYVNEALKELKAKGLNVTGSSYQPTTVALKPGGN
jgi:hypothetical protein